MVADQATQLLLWVRIIHESLAHLKSDRPGILLSIRGQGPYVPGGVTRFWTCDA
jgi:hypothetical protein